MPYPVTSFTFSHTVTNRYIHTCYLNLGFLSKPIKSQLVLNEQVAIRHSLQIKEIVCFTDDNKEIIVYLRHKTLSHFSVVKFGKGSNVFVFLNWGLKTKSEGADERNSVKHVRMDNVSPSGSGPNSKDRVEWRVVMKT